MEKRDNSRRRKKQNPNNKKNKQKLIENLAIFLDIVLILLGIYFILDGYISILVQQDESFEYQFWRVIRSISGIVVLIIGIIALRSNLKKRTDVKQPTTRRKVKKDDLTLTLGKRLAFQFPLILLFTLLTFAVLQFFGEKFGVLPVIYLSGNFFGSEAVIFLIISLSLSFFIGFLLSHFLILKLNRRPNRK